MVKKNDTILIFRSINAILRWFFMKNTATVQQFFRFGNPAEELMARFDLENN